MSSPTPILFTIPNFITAGSGQAMLNIIERLDRDRFAPAVCVSQKGGTLDREVERLGIPFIEAPFTVPAQPYPTLYWRARAAAQVFRPYGFALWHSFHYLDDYTEPLVARMAGASAWVYTKKNMNWGRRSWKLRTMLARRIAVQNTDMMRDFFGQGSFAARARLVPRGVVVERFSPDTPARLGLRGEYGISSGAFVLGCVGHLVPVKGHPTLLEAFAGLPDAHLMIAGKPLDKEYAAAQEQAARDLGIADRVHFLGGVSDIAAFHAEMDAFVLPTWAKWRQEGCPVALLEAMSCGKACVATDIPGSHDLIEHERSGMIVPPQNADALSAALLRLMRDEGMRAVLGASARKRVLDHYTIEREVADHAALYEEALAR